LLADQISHPLVLLPQCTQLLMKVVELLTSLPIGPASEVFAKLAAHDMVRLDSANLNHKSRQALADQCAECPPWKFEHSRGTDESELMLCGWFWKRALPIAFFEQLSMEFLSKMVGNEHLVYGDVELTYSGAEEHDKDLCAQLFAVPTLARKVSKLSILSIAEADPLLQHLPALSSLKRIEFVDGGSYLPEHLFVGVLRAAVPLSSFQIGHDFAVTDATVEALTNHRQTLTVLSLSLHPLGAAASVLYDGIARCSNLLDLYLDGRPNLGTFEFEPLPASAVTSIAAGCSKLQTVRIRPAEPDIDIFAVFAVHCPDLRSIGSAMVMLYGLRLTDEGLCALSDNCPRLTSLADVIWAVTEVSAVHRADRALSRLQEVSLWGRQSSLFAPEPDNAVRVPRNTTLAQAMAHMRDMQTFQTVNFAVGGAELGLLATHCTEIRTVYVSDASRDPEAVGDAIAAIAARNPQLSSLRMPDNEWLRDDVVITIAISCPRLLYFLRDGRGPSALTDEAMVALASGCTRLQRVNGLSGPHITDVSVLAFATYCQGLETLHLGRSPLVTEAALTVLVRNCRKLVSLSVCRSTIDADALQRLRAAAGNRKIVVA
jgi:hypothetical protein